MTPTSTKMMTKMMRAKMEMRTMRKSRRKNVMMIWTSMFRITSGSMREETLMMTVTLTLMMATTLLSQRPRDRRSRTDDDEGREVDSSFD